MLFEKSLRANPPKATSRSRTELDAPQTFLGFCAWLGVHLFPGQAELARVAFDGTEPVDRDVAQQLFGCADFASLPVGARDVVAAVCGGRGGKSYVLVALRLVYGMLVRDLSSLAPGQRAVALVVAPNDELRQEVVNYALGAYRSKPELAALLRLPRGTKDEDIVSEFTIRRPDGHRVTFRGGVATRGGYGGRGKSLTDFAMDEAAFFRDKSSKVNDEDIFKAASARVLPGGQTIVASTPWAESGLLYEMWRENFSKPRTAIVAHAPTTLLNGSDWAKRIVDREMKRDPENAEREFGAKFMTGGTVVFFPPGLIDACIDETLSVDEPRMPHFTDQVAAGGDLGFRSDSSALAITHLTTKPQIILAELFERQPQAGKPLKPSETVKAFGVRMRAHGVTCMMADQHYRETATEHLEEKDIAFIDAPGAPDEVYVRARQKMREGIVKFARHERLIRQLKEVQGKPLPGGKMQIILPRWAKGGHGDLVSAFVLGLWQLATDTVKKDGPEEGTPEHEAMLQDQRRQAMVAAREREKTDWRARMGLRT